MTDTVTWHYKKHLLPSWCLLDNTLDYSRRGVGMLLTSEREGCCEQKVVKWIGISLHPTPGGFKWPLGECGTVPFKHNLSTLQSST